MREAIPTPSEVNEKMGPELSEMVAQPFLNIYKEPSDENILKEKCKIYPIPANVKTLRVPRLNSWLYEIATEEQKQQDWDLQNVQTYMVASMSAVATEAQTMHDLKQWAMNSSNSKNSDKTHIFAKSFVSLMDANHFMIRAMRDINQLRRKLIRQGMADSFIELLNENEATPDWLSGVANSSAIPEVKGKDALIDELHMTPTEIRPNTKSVDVLPKGQEILLIPSLQDEDSKGSLGISTIDAEMCRSLKPSGMMTNEKERGYSEFDDADSLNPTLRIQVDRSDRVESPLICSECGMVYKCADHLNTHVKWHMEDNPANYSDGDVEFRLENLETHRNMEIHTTEAYKCSDCGQEFRNKAEQLMHSYSKHKIKKADRCSKGFLKTYKVIPVTEQTKSNCLMLPQYSNLILSQSNPLTTNTEVLINERTYPDSTEQCHVVGKDIYNHYVSNENQSDADSDVAVEYQPSNPVDQVMTDTDVKLHVDNSIAEECSQPSSTNFEMKNCTGKQINVINHAVSISLCPNIPDCKNTSQKAHACTDPANNSVYTESPKVFKIYMSERSEIKEIMDLAHDEESVVFEQDHKLPFLIEKEQDDSGPDGTEMVVLASVPKVYKYRAQGERPHVCTECGKGFKQAGHLKDHMRTHTGEKPYVCIHCGQSFSASSQLKVHLRTHTGDHSSGKPACADCGKRFSSLSSLKYHIRTHTGEKPHVCTYCTRAFSVLSTLNKHIMIHTGEKPFVCKDCGKGYRTSSCLKTHIRSHPAGNCPDCGEKFSSMDSVDAHLKTHRHNKSCDPLCSSCNKTFSTPASLRIHMHTHTEEKPFECKVCGLDFKLSSLLKTHMKSHTEQSKDCTDCGKRFRNLDILKTHMMKHANKVGIDTTKSIEIVAGPYICPKCNKKFKHAGHLRAHIRRHPGEKPQENGTNTAGKLVNVCPDYVCPDCGQACSCLKTLMLHIRSHTGEKPYVCTYCAKAFSVIGNLRSHLMIHTGEKPFVCKDCGEAFRTSANLKVHLRSHPAGNCPDCGEKFSSMDSLHAHLKTHRHNKSLDTLCSICNKTYSSPTNLKMHMRTHTGERPYLCPDCGKRFSSNNNLKNHMRIHTGEKPHRCSYCGNNFNEPGQLIKHVRIHTGERPYKCTECGKGFRTSGSLINHTRVHTGEKPYPCSDCGKKFKTHSSRKRHRRSHTGDLPYACPECGKGCHTQWNVDQHMRSHTGEKPFLCPICGKQFSDSGCLKTHITRIHT